MPWPRSARPRRAGVSSFGISGTNAHVVLEEAPADDLASERGRAAAPCRGSCRRRPRTALREQARRLRAHVDGRPELGLRDVGWSLATGRARLDRRAVVVGADRATLLAGLDAVAANEPSDAVAVGHAPARGKVAFVFPGQGSQWLGMALELWDAAPVFAEKMQACADALRPFVGVGPARAC